MASPAGNRVNTFVLSFTLVSGSIVFCRLFTRCALVRKLAIEDAFIILAMGFSIALTVSIGAQVRNGLGRHISELSPKEAIDSQKAFWASIWLYYLSLTFTKVSILVQYLHIPSRRRFHLVCFALLAFVALYGVWTLFGNIFLCFPIRFFWDKSLPDGKCLSQFAVWFSNACVNIAENFAILLIPMPVLRRLEIPAKQKNWLMAVFALGGIVCIISIVKLQTLLDIINSQDPIFDNPPAAAFAALETNLLIVAASLPSIHPLLSTILPNQFPPTRTSWYTTSGSQDEEKAKHWHSRADSTSTRPHTSSTTTKNRTHSRSTSSTSDSTGPESEPGYPSRHHATIAGTGTRINGPPRQVHIRSASQGTLLNAALAPKLPKLPENMATIGALGTHVGYLPRYYGPRVVQSLEDGGHHSRPGSKSRVEQKPLPITPFPIMPT